jgi:hypothetical protein
MPITPDSCLTWKVFSERGNVYLILNTFDGKITEESVLTRLPPAFAEELGSKLLQEAECARDQMPTW